MPLTEIPHLRQSEKRIPSEEFKLNPNMSSANPDFMKAKMRKAVTFRSDNSNLNTSTKNESVETFERGVEERKKSPSKIKSDAMTNTQS